MADQKTWFKLWCSAPGDDALQRLPPAIRWAWAALGAYTKKHGTHGRVKVSTANKVLAAEMGVELSDMKSTIKMLPNVQIIEDENDNGKFTVSWGNWKYYQEDRTAYERVKRLRSKKRGEEKRQEEKITTPLPPKGDFGKFWQAYPRHKSKATAERAFAKACTSEATLAMMLDALKRLAPEWGTRPADKIPYPATWLNARGWEDEVTVGIGSQEIAPTKDECKRCGYGRTLHLRLLDGPNKGKIMGHTHGVTKVCNEYQQQVSGQPE